MARLVNWQHFSTLFIVSFVFLPHYSISLSIAFFSDTVKWLLVSGNLVLYNKIHISIRIQISHLEFIKRLKVLIFYTRFLKCTQRSPTKLEFVSIKRMKKKWDLTFDLSNNLFTHKTDFLSTNHMLLLSIFLICLTTNSSEAVQIFAVTIKIHQK